MNRHFLPLMLFALLFSVLRAAEPSKPVTSLSDDRASVEVTVYNSNMGLIKEVRKVKLPAGEGSLRFMDVAARIDPVTVHARSLNAASDFSVLEQNYEYDLMDENKLLDKYVGKTIKLVEWKEFQDRKETVDALLLSNNNGQVYKIGDQIFLGHPGYRVLPEIPENLIAKPTLTWLFANKSKSEHSLEVSYHTADISWKADYVLVLSSAETAADLSGWVTVDNRSGGSYKGARLKLVAGNVNRVAPDEAERPRAMALMKSMVADAAQFEEKSLFEYHLYDLQRLTNIMDNQTKQISLLDASLKSVTKEYTTRAQQYWYSGSYGGSSLKQPVAVMLRFSNAKENNLGMPLPAGVVRVYKNDADGSRQFIGEDRVQHTPKNEKVELKMGEAFDLVAERKQTSYKQVTSQLHESEWEITLRNHKDADVVIGVVEPFFGNWKIVKNSHAYSKVDAFTARFDVPVAKEGEVKVTYRVQVGL